MEDELKPCPFCGGKAKLQTTCEHHAWVECSACHARFPVMSCSTPGQAVIEATKVWNRRIEEEFAAAAAELLASNASK